MNNLNDKWETNYALLCEYLEQNNGSFPPARAVYKDVAIGRWLSYVKSQLNGTRQLSMTNEQTNRIKNLLYTYQSNKAIGLVINGVEDEWQRKYLIFCEYMKKVETGELPYPILTTVYNNINLGVWLRNQKKALDNKTITKEHLQLIEEQGYVLVKNTKSRRKKESLLFEILKSKSMLDKESRQKICEVIEFKEYQLNELLTGKRSILTLTVDKYFKLLKHLGYELDDYAELSEELKGTDT